MGRALSFLMILLLKIYQQTLSRVFAFVGVRCRHEPSCSAYGIGSIKKFGSWTGGWLTLSRLLRCHPFGSHGYDPVPTNTANRGKFWQINKLGDWPWTERGVEEVLNIAEPVRKTKSELKKTDD